MSKQVEEYIRGLGLDAYLVGGAVRDELLGRESKDADFLVPGVDIATLRDLLRRYGRTEELVVAGRPVGVRFSPRDAEVRALAPAGIELAPPRREVSTGPGRHDFAIVVDPGARVEDDLARRDFTVNAIARRLSDGALVDPHGGRDDLERGILRTVGPRSFAEDPLRIVRGLRFVSQLGLEPDSETLAQMRAGAGGVRLVSGERVGGGIHADGLGELSRLLLGASPARALRLARDTGVLAALLPELASADERTFAVVQAAADAGTPLRVRVAALLHELGREQAGGGLAGCILRRLRYPNGLRERVVEIVRHHPVDLGDADALRARMLLARYGESLLEDLLDLREADLRADAPPPHGDLDRLAAFRRVVEAEREAPHRLRDLAVGGDDLLAVGFASGPQLGRALAALLEAVVRDPSLNRRDELLRRAEALRT